MRSYLCGAIRAAVAPRRGFASSIAVFKVYDGGPAPKLPSYSTSITDHLLGDVTSRYTDVAAIEAENGEPVTFATLKERVDWMAIQYYIRGWEQEEMVAVFLPNQLLFTITCLGAAKIGIPFTIVDPSSSPFELQHQLKDSRAVYIVTSQSLMPVVRQVTPAMRGLKEILILDKEENPDEKKELRFTIEMKYNLLFGKPPGWGALPDWTVKPDDTALIHYGPAVREKPPGLVISHRNLIANVLQVEKAIGAVEKSDVFLSAVPYFRLDAYTLINNLAIQKGVTAVTLIAPSVKSLTHTVNIHKVTIIRLSPELAIELSKAKKIDLPSLRKVIVDAPVPSDLTAAWKKKLPNVEIVSVHSAPFVTALSGGNEAVVKLLPGTEAKIVNENGEEVKEGQEGLLLLKGPQIGAGYLHNEEASKVVIDKEGFFKAGDRAKADKEGRFSISAKTPQEEE